MNVRISFDHNGARRKYARSTTMRRQRSGGFPTEVDVHVYETKEGDAIELTGREICDAVKSGEFTAVKALPGPTVDCGCACGDSSQPAESPAPQSEQA